MMTRWQLQDAKARLSELVKSVASDGPQEITVHGKPAAVVLAPAEYERLTTRKPSFVDFLRESPLVGAPPALKRSRSRTRRIRL
jgi:prevent-host-death family protein